MSNKKSTPSDHPAQDQITVAMLDFYVDGYQGFICDTPGRWPARRWIQWYRIERADHA